MELMNEYLLQLMNKAKYPFSKNKNIAKRRKEQAKGNITRMENQAELKMLFALGAIIVVSAVATVLIYLSVMN